MIKNSAFILLIALTASVQLPRRPTFFFHGLGSDCMSESDSFISDDEESGSKHEYKENLEADMICVETGAGVCGSTKELRKQADIACQKITKLITEKNGKIKQRFQFGFHVLGKSQGGIIARLLFQRCENLKPLIATIVADGAPNIGMSRLPDYSKMDIEVSSFWKHMMSTLAHAGEAWVRMYRRNHQHSFFQYLNTKKKRAILIDEMLDDKGTNYNDLELFVTVSYGMDETITPLTSPSFGLNIDESSGQWEWFPNSEFANRLGLGDMWKQRRFWNCRAGAEHLNIEGTEVSEYEVFTGDWCSYDGDVNDNVAIRKAYRDCTLSKMQQYNFRALICDQTQRIQLEKEGSTLTFKAPESTEGIVDKSKKFALI